jgi:glycosyltransferase involved in cell wall biosynthesis
MKAISVIQDTAVADSYITKKYLEEFYKIKNINIVPYFFKFSRKWECKDFDPLCIKIAYFGRISQRKGVDRSIKFCSLLKKEGVNFIFDIYGDGPFELYREKIKKSGLENVVNIKDKLPLHRVSEYMNRYDFLLQLSNHEGMALAVVEAMSSGLVPIVTPVGEIKRYTRDGVNAIWLDANFDNNLPALVEKIKEIINNPTNYHRISSSVAGTFINYKKYSESLIEVIDSYLKD